MSITKIGINDMRGFLGSDFDDFLAEEEIKQEVETAALEKVACLLVCGLEDEQIEAVKIVLHHDGFLQKK